MRGIVCAILVVAFVLDAGLSNDERQKDLSSAYGILFLTLAITLMVLGL